MTVSELARIAGVTSDAVRYYARTGLLTPHRNTDNGYREFAPSDLKRLRFIRRAQALGFSLAEIATIIRHAKQRKSPCPIVRDIIQRRMEDVGEELEQLMRLRERMRKAVAKWRRMPDKIPDGDEICQLIESIEVERDVLAISAVSATKITRCTDAIQPGRPAEAGTATQPASKAGLYSKHKLPRRAR